MSKKKDLAIFKENLNYNKLIDLLIENIDQIADGKDKRCSKEVKNLSVRVLREMQRSLNTSIRKKHNNCFYDKKNFFDHFKEFPFDNWGFFERTLQYGTIDEIKEECFEEIEKMEGFYDRFITIMEELIQYYEDIGVLFQFAPFESGCKFDYVFRFAQNDISKLENDGKVIDDVIIYTKSYFKKKQHYIYLVFNPECQEEFFYEISEKIRSEIKFSYYSYKESKYCSEKNIKNILFSIREE